MSDTYDLAPEFEQLVVVLLCRRPSFYRQIGHHVDPGALRSKVAELCAEAAHEIFRGTGKPPGGWAIIAQQLHKLRNDGKLRLEQIQQASEFFDVELDDVDEAQVVAQLAPVIKRVAGQRATEIAISSSEAASYQAVAKAFADVDRIGMVDTSAGYMFTPDDWSEIDAINLGGGERLSWGIPPLDQITCGGLKRGHAWLIAAGTCGGKSTMLSQLTREAWRRGLTCAYATLELAVGEVDAKIRAGLTSVPSNSLLDSKRARAECEKRLRKMWPARGGLVIKKFPARKTTWPDLVDWFMRLADAPPHGFGRLPDLWAIDFLGKLGSERKGESSYDLQGRIMDAMHDFAEEHNIWLATASQFQRGKREKQVAGTDDLNDSQGKSEGADGVLTLNGRDDGRSIFYAVAKHRGGPSNVGCGPFEHDFAFGRMCAPIPVDLSDAPPLSLVPDDGPWVPA